MDLKHALITGVVSGIGYALAHEFAKAGIPLVLVDYDTLKLKSVADEFRGTYNLDVHEIVADLSHATSPEHIFNEVQKLHVDVGYLVNNAGIGEFAQFKDAEPKRVSEIIMVNIYALTLLTRLFVPNLISNKGKILNVASIASFMPSPMLAVYFASKAYVLSLSQALVEELKNTGVTVTTLCPGATTTEFGKAAHMQDVTTLKTLSVASAEEVARYGFKVMMKGKGIAIYGFGNKVFVFIIQLLPRVLAVRYMASFYK